MALNKEDELYKASLPAFFTNEIETDKNILTLSIGAIGFYSAILMGKTLTLSNVMLFSMILSVILYGITAAMVLAIFSQNKKQLLTIIVNDGRAEENPHLSLLDKWKYLPFILAIIASIVFMLALTYSNINQKENKMNEKTTMLNGTYAQDGFSGIAKATNNTMASQSNILEKGFSGVVSANSGNNNASSQTPAAPAPTPTENK